MNWQARGACVGLDPDLFFPERGEPWDEAKAVCLGCPVRVQCLEFALGNLSLLGVWGATSHRERRRLRRQFRNTVPQIAA